jgi:hypothetical protein
MIPFISSVQNNQNWGGSLLIENLYKHHINKNADEKTYRRAGLISMLYLLFSATLISIFADSLLGMVKFLFAITAGVGPVFILRWYWWRINAWSQFSAMVSALIYPAIFDILYDKYQLFTIFINATENYLNLDYYPVKLILLTVIVCITWLTVTFLTKPTDETVLKTFVETVKPGGLWNRFQNKGKLFFKYRVLVFLLLSVNGVIIYMMFWNFLLGKYLLFSFFFSIFIVIFFVVYRLINKINTKHAETLI